MEIEIEKDMNLCFSTVLRKFIISWEKLLLRISCVYYVLFVFFLCLLLVGMYDYFHIIVKQN